MRSTSRQLKMMVYDGLMFLKIRYSRFSIVFLFYWYLGINLVSSLCRDHQFQKKLMISIRFLHLKEHHHPSSISSVVFRYVLVLRFKVKRMFTLHTFANEWLGYRPLFASTDIPQAAVEALANSDVDLPPLQEHVPFPRWMDQGDIKADQSISKSWTRALRMCYSTYPV